jgi:PAS domain S-box-containing protein
MTKKTREEQAEEVLSQFADAPIGLCYFDSDLRYRYINAWLADMNGMSPEQHIGKTIHEVVKDVAVAVVPQLRRVLETGEPILDGVAEVPTPGGSGERTVFRHSYHPARDSDGRIVGVSCVVQDVTELRFSDSTLYEGLEKVRTLLAGPPEGF